MTDVENAALEPGPPGRRLIAGGIDSVALVTMIVLCFWYHVTRAGSSAPLWTVAGLAVVWNVLPAWATGSTLGLRLMGLRLIGRDGSDPDLVELTMRELFGRGVVFAAYLSSFVLAVVSSLIGYGVASTLPTGLALMLLTLASLGFMASMAGQAMIFLNKDHRSGADLISKLTVVRIAPPAPEEADEESEEEKSWRAQSAHRRWLWAAILGVLCLVVAVGVPLINDLELTTDPYARAHALKQEEELNTLKLRFEQVPADPEIANALAAELRARGRRLEATEVLEIHREELREVQDAREGELLSALAAGDNWDALWELSALYEQQDRLDEAKGIFAEFVESGKTPDDKLQRKASFGVWLYKRDFNEDAVVVLRAAIAEGWDTGRVHAYLGFALENLNRSEEAHRAFVDAVDQDPGLEDQLGWRIEELEQELGIKRRKRQGKRKRKRKR